MERTFQESAQNLSQVTDKFIKSIKKYQLPTRHQTRTVYGGRTCHSTGKT